MKRQSLNAFVIILFTLLIGVLFWEPLTSSTTLYSMDQAPLYTESQQTDALSNVSGYWWVEGMGHAYRSHLNPMAFLQRVLSPLQYHVWSYILMIALLGIAIYKFMRLVELPKWVCGASAIGLCYSGYLFTLISAGHRNAFAMYPFVVFSLYFVNKAIKGGRWKHYAFAGGSAGLGFASGAPDKMILFSLLIGAYGLFLLLSRFRSHGSRIFKRFIPGVVLAGLFFGGFVFGTYAFLFNKDSGAVAFKQDLMGKTKESKWEYCTNWSLPPEDMLEFVAPCVRGIETTDPKGPYWGRLGMPAAWEGNVIQLRGVMNNPSASPQQKQAAQGQLQQLLGRMNYRQHTVYLGVLPVVFAFFALFLSIPVVRNSSILGSANNDSQVRKKLEQWAGSIQFWSAAGFLCMILSFGRYTPIYKLFYSLPVINQIRCPVKIHHLVEVCMAVLFAYGLGIFLYILREREQNTKSAIPEPAESTKRKKKNSKQKAQTKKPVARISTSQPRAYSGSLLLFAVLSIFIGLVFLGFAMSVTGNGGFMREYWNSIGRGAYASVFAKNMSGALLHGGLLFLFSGGLFLTAVLSRFSISRILPFILLPILALDVGIVAKKYIRTKDMTDWYKNIPISQDILAAGPGVKAAWVADGRAYPRTGRHWLWGNLRRTEIDFVEDRVEQPLKGDVKSIFDKTARNPEKLWQLTGVNRILGQAERLRPLSNQPGYKVEKEYSILGSEVRETTSGKGNWILLSKTNSIPKAVVFHNWIAVESAKALDTVTAASFDSLNQLVVEPDLGTNVSESPPSPVDILSYSTKKIELSTTLAEAGILLLNDRVHANWVARVNGSPVEIHPVNGFMRGLKLEPGVHQIEFTYLKEPAAKWGWRIGLTSLLVLCFWGLADPFLRREPKTEKL